MRNYFNTALCLFLFGIGMVYQSCNTSPLNCEKLWALENPNEDKATFRKGFLTLSAEDMVAIPALSFTQDSLAGNFVAFLEYEEFTRPDDGNGTYLRLFVQNTHGPDSLSVAIASIGDASPAGLGVQLGAFANTDGLHPNGEASDFVTSSGTSGSLSIFRSDDQITISAQDDEGNHIEKTFSFNLAPVQIGFALGSNQDTLSGESSVKLSSFQLSTLAVGGTLSTVESDDFDCESIK